MSNEVYLAIYDLSMGTARQLSSMFLGPDNIIPIIPHTAIIVYNYEYFFSSGGVQKVNSNVFRNSRQIQPIEQKLIGRTSKPQAEFEQWLFFGNDVPTRYHGSRYDLFHHNCNNFSDYCLRHGLDLTDTEARVPQWILDVPQRVMSSPFGSMLAQSMQGVQPFGDENMAPTAAPQQSTPSSSSSAATSENPWRSNASVNNSSKANDVTLENPWKNLSDSATQSQSVINKTTPILDSHGNILLSQDSSAMKMCMKKLKNHDAKDNIQQQNAIRILDENITKSNQDISSSSFTSDVVIQALSPFFNYNEKESSCLDQSMILYSLMVLRILLLRKNPTLQLKPLLLQVSKLLLNSDDVKLKESAKSMAWCTLSNAFCNEHHWKELVSSHIDSLVDVALADISSSSSEAKLVSLKQAACTFLYNLVHSTSFDEMTTLPDWAVNLLVCMGQSLEEEKDVTTQERRIVILGKILKNSLKGRELVKELGFENCFSGEVAEKNKQLSIEVSSMV